MLLPSTGPDGRFGERPDHPHLPDGLYRAQYMAVFLLCIPLSSFLGSPISGAILGMDGLWGLKGWQWMFILEGAPWR
jgi:MFS family permease